MVREIEFKGVSCTTGEYLYGNLVKTEGRYYITSQKERDDALDYNLVYEDTISQFTGFYDRNNNKIFENDILEANLCNEETFKVQIKWDVINAYFYSELLDSEINKDNFKAEPIKFYFNIFRAKKSLKVFGSNHK